MWKRLHTITNLTTVRVLDKPRFANFLVSIILVTTTVKVFVLCAPDYCYEQEDCGPLTWGDFCQIGAIQSPINLERSKVKKVDKPTKLVLSREYAMLHTFFLKNDGHTVHVTLTPEEISQCLVKGNGFLPNEPYFFSSLHFHWGSNDFIGAEHLIDGQRYPLELHMIHRQVSDNTKVAVFGILYKIGNNDNPALNSIVANLEVVVNASDTPTPAPLAVALNLTDLLPKKVKVFRYLGSLTTPPCSEGIIWTVFDDIQTISQRQLMAFRRLMGKDLRPIRSNFRPTQPTFTNQRKNVFYMKSVVPTTTSAIIMIG